MLKDDCGGNFIYLENGIKDCSNCTLPHIKGSGYQHVMNKMDLVLGRTLKKED
jgi:Zn-finger protein